MDNSPGATVNDRNLQTNFAANIQNRKAKIEIQNQDIPDQEPEESNTNHDGMMQIQVPTVSFNAKNKQDENLESMNTN